MTPVDAPLVISTSPSLVDKHISPSDSDSDDQKAATESHSQHISPYTKLSRSLGFHKAYNLPLWVIFGGAMLGFSLARLQYLDINGIFAKNIAPGEWYWYRAGHYHVGIVMHLGCILPAGLLMVWQFVPIIRRRAMLFHRINGYLIIVLVIVSNVGAMLIVRRAFGGLLATQAAVGSLVIYTTAAIALAYINIKRLQIDQHRAWMLRAMFALGTIITTRLIMLASAPIISIIGSYYTTFSCDELHYMYGSAVPVERRYPACKGNLPTLGSSPNSTSLEVAVHANINGNGPEQAGASLRLSFSMAVWVAIALHVLGVEMYLHLTPAESRRLKDVSREKQSARGLASAGSAGLTVERLGDV